MKNVYFGYVKHVVAIEKGTEAAKELTKFSDKDITYGSSGFPQIPAPIKNNNGIETSLTQQQIIRAYLKAHYGGRHLNDSMFQFFMRYSSRIWQE